ncbi:hypothetical protein LEP1GSC088_3622 [Leptospira interrogans str. L1207]|nr:hypothetical protein LEP1GSC088_3622 [Leptospira interrogans str. L1207]
MRAHSVASMATVSHAPYSYHKQLIHKNYPTTEISISSKNGKEFSFIFKKSI